MLITGLILGAVLGAVMQRGRFCVTGMLRDIFTRGTWRPFTALLIVISVHAIGLTALTSAGIITPEYSPFAPAAVIVGAFIFGVSIVLAGGCASGTWYRAGEGLVGSWLALVGYALSAAAMKTGPLSGVNAWLRQFTVGQTTVPATFGLSPWWFAIGLGVLTAYLAARFLQAEFSGPRPVSLAQPLHRRPLHVYLAAVIIGVIGVVAWPLSAATGRNDGLGITTPSKNVANYIVTGDSSFLDWGALLVLGILVGALIAAKVSGEFRVRVPDARTSSRAVVGGIGMGVGASWAGGCTVGNGMVQTSLFTYQGWVALAFFAVGVGVAAKIWLKPSGRKTAAGTYSTDESVDGRAAHPETATTSVTAPAYAVAPVALKVREQQSAPAGLTEVAPGEFALDTLGAVCPFPLIEAVSAMDELRSGQTLVIDFDCTQATDAIPRWAAEAGHEVTEFRATGDAGWRTKVRKG
ncbi:YeeE/YedE thiosulfate transporter family protein [Corynebacterium sp. P5875]|uniref:YeeE/YedE thiosulfate transporter family protein n=1 Tax=Corynebacterium antarcticum TaxID=2800405 RepID=A0A9Q4GK56_9CORY|nr:YeeE/YedE thiosulfate transporter family protein [Corynebacterium antarcticum]MCX7537592.1 YeeE/YedE thiosulfate transporter family protein [Corynebacterium antarcticum]